MKKLIFIYFTFISIIALSQQIEVLRQQNYDYQKMQRSLNPKNKYQIIPNIHDIKHTNVNSSQPKIATTTTGACSCLLPVDNTYSVVPFSNGFAPDYRCDDGSSPIITLPFSFVFYGTTYNSLYINNNGNVTFNNYFYSFSAGGFPAGEASNLDTIMIAPFWGDADSNNPLSGLVYYKITPTSIIIKWDSIGYYATQANLRNTFQLILTDGNDPILSNGNNVAFCYGDMQWTTGDASMGTSGIGGIPATVGVNKGDALNYFQVQVFQLFYDSWNY